MRKHGSDFVHNVFTPWFAKDLKRRRRKAKAAKLARRANRNA